MAPLPQGEEERERDAERVDEGGEERVDDHERVPISVAVDRRVGGEHAHARAAVVELVAPEALEDLAREHRVGQDQYLDDGRLVVGDAALGEAESSGREPDRQGRSERHGDEGVEMVEPLVGQTVERQELGEVEVDGGDDAEVRLVRLSHRRAADADVVCLEDDEDLGADDEVEPALLQLREPRFVAVAPCCDVRLCPHQRHAEQAKHEQRGNGGDPALGAGARDAPLLPGTAV